MDRYKSLVQKTANLAVEVEWIAESVCCQRSAFLYTHYCVVFPFHPLNLQVLLKPPHCQAFTSEKEFVRLYGNTTL
jgi:hypothetical protein